MTVFQRTSQDPSGPADPGWFHLRSKILQQLSLSYLSLLSENEWQLIRQKAVTAKGRMPGTESITDADIPVLSREDVVSRGLYWTDNRFSGSHAHPANVACTGHIAGYPVYYNRVIHCFFWEDAEHHVVAVITLRFPVIAA